MVCVGQKISKIRKEKKISQAKLAEMINISPSSLCRFERGLYEPSYEILEKICEVLDIPLSEIFVQSKTEPEIIEETCKPNQAFKAVTGLSILINLVALIVFLFIILPKFRVIESSTRNIEGQGETMVVKVLPTLIYSEKEADRYSRRLFDKYEGADSLDALEIWYLKSAKTTDDFENTYLISTRIYTPQDTQSD